MIKDPVTRQKPLNYYDKNYFILPDSNNSMTNFLQEMLDFTNKPNEKINKDKFKVMVFNPTKNFQFPPEMGFEKDEHLEYWRQSKILSIIVTDSLKWSENTKYITEKAMSRIWTLRRIKKLGFDNDAICDVYCQEIRSVLEFGIPVWNGDLTEKDSQKIESVQRKGFRIIQNRNYIDYENACIRLNSYTLKSRRENICLNFALKEYRKEHSMFNKLKTNRQTRNNKSVLVEEYTCHSDRFYKSSYTISSKAP